MTRNHFIHHFENNLPPLAYASCDNESVRLTPESKSMISRQAPRKIRLAAEELERSIEQQKLTGLGLEVNPLLATKNAGSPPSSPATKLRRLSTGIETSIRMKPTTLTPPPSLTSIIQEPIASTSSTSTSSTPLTTAPLSSIPIQPIPTSVPLPPLIVKCHVRTRIPTPHGHVFLYLYKNNHDDKEHLAFVADQAQMDALPGEAGPSSAPFLRSETLDSQWRPDETEMERIVRGAYVGRLTKDTVTPSVPGLPHATPNLSRRSSSDGSRSINGLSTVHPHHHVRSSGIEEHLEEEAEEDLENEREPPLVRIHSECFTGETIGSQRCDCGEQLDEAFRLITEVGRGVVVYLRQEGRGIGLLEKMRAYNLQDLGHDTVTANLLLGHGADLRVYDIAGAILRDLDVGEVRLLTNNPDKIEQIEKEGISVVERVAMVPRSWMPQPKKRSSGGRRKKHTLSGAALLALATENMLRDAHTAVGGGENEDEEDDDSEDDDSLLSLDDDNISIDSDASHNLRRAGVGMIGGSKTQSFELEKYLRTKVERMGHLLAPPPTPPG